MIVFAGPSIAGVELPAGHGIDIRPPVRQGDVYLATLTAPTAIGVIDGYFDGMPSVWHKEILWAMSQGIAVLGASSMGALRAAELDAFGMVGVGAIYGDYRDGVLEDDDEVALVHGPAELGYAPLSVAMVNLRATMLAAIRAGVIARGQAEVLTDHAKSIFFKERTWSRLLDGASSPDLAPQLRQTLYGWIDANEVNQKREDACALLNLMISGDVAPAKADFHFESTDLWLRCTETWRHRRDTRGVTGSGGYRLLGEGKFFG